MTIDKQAVLARHPLPDGWHYIDTAVGIVKARSAPARCCVWSTTDGEVVIEQAYNVTDQRAPRQVVRAVLDATDEILAQQLAALPLVEQVERLITASLVEVTMANGDTHRGILVRGCHHFPVQPGDRDLYPYAVVARWRAAKAYEVGLLGEDCDGEFWFAVDDAYGVRPDSLAVSIVEVSG